jgi:hypothetical protein
MPEAKSVRSWKTVIQIIVALLLLVLGCWAVVSSDATLSGTYGLWIVAVVVYGLADFGSHVAFRDHSAAALKTVPAIVLHWAGVFCAIYLMYYFAAAGRIANADTGLANGVILSLGLFTAGVHGNWRMIVVGTILALATAGVATFERYIWLFVLLVSLAAIVLVVGARLEVRRRDKARALTPEDAELGD